MDTKPKKKTLLKNSMVLQQFLFILSNNKECTIISQHKIIEIHSLITIVNNNIAKKHLALDATIYLMR